VLQDCNTNKIWKGIVTMSDETTTVSTLDEDLQKLRGMLAERREKTGGEWRQANRECERFADQLVSKWGSVHTKTIKNTLMGIK
jgi:hypothetical protein